MDKRIPIFVGPCPVLLTSQWEDGLMRAIIRSKTNVQLKSKILESYCKQYLAARDLGIRDDILSAIIMGRRQPDEELIRLLELKLKCSRSELGIAPTGEGSNQ